MTNYAAVSAYGYEPDINDTVEVSLFSQYEKVIFKAITTSFGLDFLVHDRHGGDVDTIHNVRQIGKDPEMTYKNKRNEEAYNNRGEYNSTEYHSDSRYKEKNREISSQKKNGTLNDAYTDNRLKPNDKTDLDHVISAKEINDDRGRVLAGIKGTDLANDETNLQPTNSHTNRSKKADTMDEYLEKHSSEYTEEQRQRMKEADRKAREHYNNTLAYTYYTGKAFIKDTATAAGKVGINMGIRQVLGYFFTEIWFAVKEEFVKLDVHPGLDMDLGNFFSALSGGIKRGWKNAVSKYSELIKEFFTGALSGALSSITTTVCNIFFTTSRNVVKIIRESWASLVEAAKILFLNPDRLPFGERMRAAIKVIATGASVIFGSFVKGIIDESPLGKIPVIGAIVSDFCGAFITGILSCTLLYFLDRNTIINFIVDKLNLLTPYYREISFYKKTARQFEAYAAQLAGIDTEKFRMETAAYHDIAMRIENVSDETELNILLRKTLEEAEIRLSWQETHSSFDDFMSDKNAVLVIS